MHLGHSRQKREHKTFRLKQNMNKAAQPPTDHFKTIKITFVKS